MKNYYRVMLGQKSVYAEECFSGGFFGADFGLHQDLTEHLPEQQREFNQQFRPIWMKSHPEKSKASAGMSCGALHTVCKGIREGDMLLCPDGQGAYRVAEVTEPYSYRPGEILPHRRGAHWHSDRIKREDMSIELRNSTGSIGTVSNITKYAEEIETLMTGHALPALVATDENVEDPSVFALEKYLEEFLVSNWQQTELGRNYDIYEEDGEVLGQQFPSDTGPIDILAISRDKKELLVIELKKGRASDVVVGQIQRYMGYVLEELAESDQLVKGIIIALDDDLRIRRALKVAQGIEFYRYQVSFKLLKGES